MYRLVANLALGLVCLVACSEASSVQAKDYDQSCTNDGECVLVGELIATGTSCSITCPRAGINLRERERFSAEMEREQQKCQSVAAPECAVPLRAMLCRSNRCTAVAPEELDAGTD